jgi:type IV pilus biogenesis/stability protein PilW
MSLIIDAIKRAQQLRLKDLKGTPFFSGPDPRREKRGMGQKPLWALICLLLFLSGTLFYTLWKFQRDQKVVPMVNASPQDPLKEDLHGLRRDEASAPRTEWPSLWEKYETEETVLNVPEKPKRKKKKTRKTTVSVEGENNKLVNPLPPEVEKPSASMEAERAVRIDKRQIPPPPPSVAPPLPEAPLLPAAPSPPADPPLPDHAVRKPAPALPKQEAMVKPKSEEVERGKNRGTSSEVLILFNSGVDLYDQGDYSKALQAYQKVIELDPEYAEAYNNLGIIYQEIGDFDRALSAYQNAIGINPKYEKALNNLGVLLYLEGRYEESIQAFQQALAINANNVESHINLGILFKKQGQVDKAMAAYDRALTLNPFYGEAHYNMGLLYEQLKKMEMAIGHYQKFIQMASKTHPDLVAQVKKHLNYLHMVRKNRQE